MSNQPILDALLSPRAVQPFLTQHWPRRPFVAHGSLARFPAALRATELSNIYALAQRYTGRVAITRGRKTDKMLPVNADPGVLFNMGLTVVLEDIASCVPGAPDFLRGLERELGLNENCASMSAFASPQTDGVSCHYDALDVISIQLQGTKRFHHAPVTEIENPYGTQYGRGEAPYDELYTQVSNGFPDDRRAKFETVEMHPGSVLFVPRATWHYTEADEQSLSLSIVLRPPVLMDCALEQLRWLMLQDAGWRQPLYGARPGDAMHQDLRRHIARMLERLPEVIAALSPEAMIRSPLTLEERLEQINDDTRFQTIPAAVLEIDTANMAARGYATATIREGSTAGLPFFAQVDISSDLVPVFRWVSDQSKPFNGAALRSAFPNMPAENRKSLLQMLARARLIKLIWFPELHARSDHVHGSSGHEHSARATAASIGRGAGG